MPNPQIDQFVHSLFWKLAPWIILAAAVGTFAGLVVKWLERRAIRFGRNWRARRAAQQSAGPAEPKRDENGAPHCPICNNAMVKRRARKGANAGQFFWGCSRYPDCRGTREATKSEITK